MIDLVPILSTAAAEIGKGFASQVGKRLVDAFTKIYEKRHGTPPDFPEISSRETNAVFALAPDVRDLAVEYLAQSTALTRAQVVAQALEKARVLWIDDHPSWNRLECKALESLGVNILTVESTESALSCLVVEEFDLVISDISRGDMAAEGIKAIPHIRELTPNLPIVFYVGHVSGPVPQGAFGITADPNELMHLCMDVFERSRL